MSLKKGSKTLESLYKNERFLIWERREADFLIGNNQLVPTVAVSDRKIIFSLQDPGKADELTRRSLTVIESMNLPLIFGKIFHLQVESFPISVKPRLSKIIKDSTHVCAFGKRNRIFKPLKLYGKAWIGKQLVSNYNISVWLAMTPIQKTQCSAIHATVG